MRDRARQLLFGAGTVAVIAVITRAATVDLMLAALVVSVLSLGAVMLGLLVHGTARGGRWVRSWQFLGGALALLLAAQIADLASGGVAGPTPLQARAIQVAGQLVAGVGLLNLLWQRIGVRCVDAAAEAVIGSLALGFFAWALLVDAAGTPISAEMAGAAVAVMLGAVLTWLCTQLLTLTANHPAGYRYLFLALTGLLLLEAVTVGGYLADLPVAPDEIAAVRLWCFSLWGAAALHPSLVREFEPVPVRSARTAISRVVVVALGVVAAPAVFAIRLLTHQGEPSTTVLFASAVLPVVVVGYLLRQVHERATSEYRAQHDALTGLPNRVLFHDRLTMALSLAQRYDESVAVLFLDLDRFKNINDSLGHDVGNVLLQAVAARLRSVLRQQDTVARMGGDEFTILLPRIPDAAHAVRVAEKIIASFAEPIPVGKRQLRVQTSVGIALFPDHGGTPETLVKHADTAMYRAKARGQGRYELYSERMSARAAVKLSLETNLRSAIERDALELHYQPKVDHRTHTITGLEALVRWPHPRLGFVPPAAFVPLAEESGLILELGEWVLQRACRDLAGWRDEGLPVVPIAVNFSARQFTQQRIDLEIQRALEGTALTPELLEIELTESVFLRDTTTTMRNVARLHEMGIKCAIDDFGTGFSGLNYLSRMPIDSLKIDRSFISGLAGTSDAALVQAVIALANSMGMKVIAEGVETSGQAAILLEKGCDLMQGYFFARPLPAGGVPDLLQRNAVPSEDELLLRACSPELARLLAAVNDEDDDTDLDTDLVAATLRALDHDPLSAQARRLLSRSMSARVALGSFAGLIPLSGGLAAADVLPDAVQTVAAGTLATVGIDLSSDVDRPGWLLAAGSGGEHTVAQAEEKRLHVVTRGLALPSSNRRIQAALAQGGRAAPGEAAVPDSPVTAAPSSPAIVSRGTVPPMAAPPMKTAPVPVADGPSHSSPSAPAPHVAPQPEQRPGDHRPSPRPDVPGAPEPGSEGGETSPHPADTSSPHEQPDAPTAPDPVTAVPGADTPGSGGGNPNAGGGNANAGGGNANAGGGNPNAGGGNANAAPGADNPNAGGGNPNAGSGNPGGADNPNAGGGNPNAAPGAENPNAGGHKSNAGGGNPNELQRTPETTPAS